MTRISLLLLVFSILILNYRELQIGDSWEEIAMKIVMKVEKQGKPVAQFAYELDKGEKPEKGAARALIRLCKANPDLSLFDSDVEVKFEKME